mmetsp:Transcript_17319/g.43481  ORF Transcript_17319/g.43481 Transcript_17319/m.43481 type:complete len:262 (+) Transcript_17319:2668-3453(+)
MRGSTSATMAGSSGPLLVRVCVPLDRKSTSLTTLSTSALSSSLIAGASAMVAVLAPGSSTGRRASPRPRRTASAAAWSRDSASTLLTTSSITNDLNHAPSGDSMNLSASRVWPLPPAPAPAPAAAMDGTPVAVLRAPEIICPMGDASKIESPTAPPGKGTPPPQMPGMGIGKGKPPTPSTPGWGKSGGKPGKGEEGGERGEEEEASGMVEVKAPRAEEDRRLGESARSPAAELEATWKSSSATSRSIRRSASNTPVRPYTM